MPEFCHARGSHLHQPLILDDDDLRQIEKLGNLRDMMEHQREG